MKFHLSEPAKEDLSEIGEYIFQNDPAAAERLMQAFLEKFELLTKFPNMGKERNELVVGLRSFPVGN